MSVTPVIVATDNLGGSNMVVASIPFDSSYPVGGEAISPKTFGLDTIQAAIPGAAGGYLFEWDYANNKIKAFTPTAAASASVTPLLLSYGGKDIKGSANTDSENADQAALPTNGALVGAETAVAAGAYTAPALTNPDLGRNVCVVFHNDSGGALNLFEGVMTFTITGTWRGAAQSTAITFTSTAGNKAVANLKYRYKYGNKPFDTVTAVTVDNICDNALKIAVGIGSKVGLPTDLATPAAADVIKISRNAADLASTGIVDTANMTLNLGALADNNDFNIVYKAKSPVTAVAGTPAAECSEGTNLSAVTCRMVLFGR